MSSGFETAIVHLKSAAPYQQGKYINTAEILKNDGEGHDAYEMRTWPERCHYYKKSRKLYIPGIAFKKALDEATRYRKKKIPGEGQTTWMSFFHRGIMVIDDIELPITVDEVEATSLFVPSDGKPGGGSRVMKMFPTIHEWEGTLAFHILEPKITEAIFKEYMEIAGKFVGIGVWRPEKKGTNGRFQVVDVEWPEALKKREQAARAEKDKAAKA